MSFTLAWRRRRQRVRVQCSFRGGSYGSTCRCPSVAASLPCLTHPPARVTPLHTGGVAVAPSAVANKYSQEELRLMKSQDVGYLTLKSQAEAKVRGEGREAASRCDRVADGGSLLF